MVMGMPTVSWYAFWASPKNSMRSVTVSAIDVFHNIDGRETVAQEGPERKGHPFATSCVLRNPGVLRRWSWWGQLPVHLSPNTGSIQQFLSWVTLPLKLYVSVYYIRRLDQMSGF